MSDASYSIDIAATMPAGEATATQLEALGEALLGAAAQSTKFFQQIQQLSDALNTAKAASTAANAALAEGNAQYRELEKAANVAAKAAEKAAASGKLDPAQSKAAFEANAALEAYAVTLKGLEGAASGAAAGESKLASQLEKVRVASKAADAEIAKQAKDTEAASRAAADAAAKEVRAAEQAKAAVDAQAAATQAQGAKAQKAGLNLLGFGEKFEKIGQAASTSSGQLLLFVGATAAVVTAVAAITAAVIAGAIAIAAWAVGLADASRNARLQSEALEAAHPELIALRGTIDDLTKQTGMHSDELQELAGRLKEAGVSADRMAGALSDAALAETALGKGGANDFIADIKASKGAVTGLANETRLAFGGIVAKQMRGLSAQSETLKRNIGSLFGGLNIEPVLAGLERLGALFDQNTAAGQAIKFLFESVFQPLIDQADKASIVIESFALGFLIGMTKLYIALKPVAKAIADFFGFDDPTTANTLDMVKTAGEFVASAFVAFIGILGALGVALGAVVTILSLPIIALAALSVAVYTAGSAIIGGFMSAWGAVRDFLTGFSLVEVGTNIIAGLANGLLNAGPAVLKAITGVVSDAIGAAKHLLGIASPSKVFAEIGGYTGEGFSQGVDDSAPDAQAAMSDMVDPGPAAAKAGGAGAAVGASSSSAPTVHIENLYLAGEKASDAETQSLSEALTRLIRGDAAALGGEAAPA